MFQNLTTSKQRASVAGTRRLPPYILPLFPELQRLPLRGRGGVQQCGRQLRALRFRGLGTAQLFHGLAQAPQTQQARRSAVERLAPAVVVVPQQLVENGTSFLQLRQVGFQPQLARLLDVAPPRTVRDEGIRVVKALVERAGVVRAVGAEPDSAVLQRAAGDAAALVALPAAGSRDSIRPAASCTARSSARRAKNGCIPAQIPSFFASCSAGQGVAGQPGDGAEQPASSMSSTRM